MANKVRPGPLARLVTNFMNSLKNGRHIDSKPQVVGEDYIGNRYYEIPANPSHGKRRPRRWYTSPASNYHDPRGSNITEGFDNEVPSEWESWLRNRRELPPSDAEILQSYAIADLKKVKEDKQQVLSASLKFIFFYYFLGLEKRRGPGAEKNRRIKG